MHRGNSTTSSAETRTPDTVDRHGYGWATRDDGLYVPAGDHNDPDQALTRTQLHRRHGPPIIDVVPADTNSQHTVIAALIAAAHHAVGSLAAALFNIHTSHRINPVAGAIGTDAGDALWVLASFGADTIVQTGGTARSRPDSVDILTLVIYGWCTGHTITPPALALPPLTAHAINQLGGWSKATDLGIRSLKASHTLRAYLTGEKK